MPCQVEDIPNIDAVVISHNHYDHMDHPTIMKIKAKHPNVHFFVPLGNKKWFVNSGINEGVTELDWWEQLDIDLAPSASKPAISNTDVKPNSAGEKKISARIGCLRRLRFLWKFFYHALLLSLEICLGRSCSSDVFRSSPDSFEEKY